MTEKGLILPKFKPDGIDPAYVPNSLLVRNKFGFQDESEVPIKKIVVRNACGTYPFEIGEGKYKSALWVWAWFNKLTSAQKGFDTEKSMYRFVMDDEAKANAWQYFGKKTCQDAAREDTKHGLLNALLYGKGVPYVYFL